MLDKFNAVSSTIFGPIKGFVCTGNKIIHVFPHFIFRKADGNGNLKIGANVWKWDFFDVGTQTFSADKRPIDIRLRKYDQEFLATIACAIFRVAHGSFHRVGDCLQYRITYQMPIGVIHIFEVVNIRMARQKRPPPRDERFFS